MQELVQLLKKQLDPFVQSSLMVDKKKKHKGEFILIYVLRNHTHVIVGCRYTQYLRGARKSGLKKEIVTGLTMGVYFVILFGIGGLAYW